MPLTPKAQSAVAEAKAQTFAQADTAGLPPRQAAAVASAVQDASVEAFHVGMGISAALVALGGLLGLVFIVNPVRVVRAEGCSGGQIAGVPEDLADARPRTREPVPA